MTTGLKVLALILLSTGACTFTHTQGDCDVTTSIEQRTVTVCKEGSRTVIRLPLPIPLE
jgi:hypothetical protein